MPDDDDPLHDLRSRIRDTQDAAERLVGEASSARQQHTPPSGWATPEDHEQRTSEVQSLVALLESLRALIPDELREQFRELMRQVLLLARAVIDWWVERIDTPSASGEDPPPAVQDIPVG